MKLKQILSSTLALSLLATSALAESPLRQSDFEDISGHWGEGQIIEATERGFFKGQEETLFAPNATITRAEFTVVMLKLRDVTTDDTNNEGNAWYTPYYNNAAEMGILPDNFTLENFGENITREEMAASLIKTIGQGNFDYVDGNEQEIPDYDTITAEFADFATQAFAAGFMKGDESGNFTPTNNATRAEATVVVLNAADYIYDMSAGEESQEPGDMLPGSPVSELLASILNASRSEDDAAAFPVINSAAHPGFTMVETLLGFSADQVDGFAVAIPEVSAAAYCVALVMPAEGQTEAIEAAFATFKENSITGAYQSYIDIVEAATCVTLDNGVVVFVMAENGEDILNALTSALADVDLSDVTTDSNVGDDMLLDDDMTVDPEEEVDEDMTVDPEEEDAGTDDEATDDEATDDEATDDEATDDEATDDEATDDEATDDEATVLVGNDLSESFKVIMDEARADTEGAVVPAITTAEDTMWQFIQPLFGFTEDQLDGFSIAMPMQSSAAYCVAILKPAEGQLEAIEENLAAFKEAQISSAYPGQIEITEDAICMTLESGIVIFVMDVDAEAIAEKIVAALEA